MQLEIIKQPDISLNTLQQRQAEGFSVMRSAHVGNARLYNQVLANAGITMLLVDHNVTGIDSNYVPEAIIAGGQATLLTEEGQLSMRTKVTNPANDEPTYLDQLHSSSLMQAFPATEIFTNTNYLRDNVAMAGEIVAICSKEMPELFRRGIQKDETTTSNLRTQRSVDAENVLQLTDDPRTDAGFLLPNEIDIVCNFLIEALTSERDVQFHVSGPDMMRYIKGILPTLETLYAAVAREASFAQKLPPVLRVELVPGTALRLAGTNAGKAALEGLASAITEYQEGSQKIKDKKSAFFSSTAASSNDQKKSFLADMKLTEQGLLQDVIAQAASCPDFTDDGSEQPTLTQYDTLNDGGLFVPEIASALTMRQLQKLSDLVVQQRARGNTS